MADEEDDYDDDDHGGGGGGGNDDNDDDDEDDEEEDDDDEEAEESVAPRMQGKLTVGEGRLWWVGRWAVDSSSEATSKFKYGGPAAASEAALSDPPSGAWNGYFMNPTDEGDDAKIREKGVTLTFSSEDDGTFSVAGGGSNDFGEFRLSGTYSTHDKSLTVTKQYLTNADDDEIEPEAFDDDYDDELAGLKEEQDMPIEELAKRYAYYGEPPREESQAGVNFTSFGPRWWTPAARRGTVETAGEAAARPPRRSIH
eukprot:CAMPEP_0197413382 /NCGR_PEP_ID=MMETSP1170-20131217/260_1 /TAXON_ID=54406 /ORGANISM="Sarcinochrysis sp, Strain CCMP770" /LENGTH=254 /DNA_ID=CAMNT_0042939945 /DNA_START=26 /DNA_END=789 /DNA_ORIENTATION=-